MRWNTESFSDETKRKDAPYRAKWIKEREWHRWFAWHPVQVGDGTEAFSFEGSHKAWLCFVERRLGGFDRDIQPHWFNWWMRDFIYRFPSEKS